MIGISEMRAGRNIVLEGEPYVILSHSYSKISQAKNVCRIKIKNLLTGAVLEKSYQGSDKVAEADISKSKAQFLYREGENYAFMDNASYEQFYLTGEVLGNLAHYLIDGTEVTVLSFNGQPINIEIPVKMNFRVVDAPPGIKGNSVATGGKIVTLETGLKINAPLFINVGDVIIVNTEKGEYVSRA